MSAPEVIKLPTPYPVGRINAYLLRGEVPTLLDTGVRSDRSLAELDAAFDERGLRVEDLEQLLLTHPHYDHAGAAEELSRRADVAVCCHPEGIREDRRNREVFMELIARYGAPAKVPEQLRAAWTAGDVLGRPLGELSSLKRLGDGEVLRAGDLDVEVVHTPGHSPGHVCYLARREGLLLCGDLLLADITPNPLPHFDRDAPRGRRPSLALYLASLDRIEALGPLRGLPGHGEPLEDTVAAVRAARRHVRERNEVLYELVRDNPGKSLFALAEIHFGQPAILGQALAFCEVLAHVDLLEEEGRVEVDAETGIPRTP